MKMLFILVILLPRVLFAQTTIRKANDSIAYMYTQITDVVNLDSLIPPTKGKFVRSPHTLFGSTNVVYEAVTDSFTLKNCKHVDDFWFIQAYVSKADGVQVKEGNSWTDVLNFFVTKTTYTPRELLKFDPSHKAFEYYAITTVATEIPWIRITIFLGLFILISITLIKDCDFSSDSPWYNFVIVPIVFNVVLGGIFFLLIFCLRIHVHLPLEQRMIVWIGRLLILEIILYIDYWKKTHPKVPTVVTHARMEM